MLTAFYTFFYNFALWSKLAKLIEINSLHSLLFFVSIPVFVFAVINILFTLISIPYLKRPLYILFIVIGCLVSYFAIFYHAMFDLGMMQNVMQTDVSESMDLFSMLLLIWVLLMGVLPVLYIALVKINTANRWYKELGFKLLNIVASVLVILVIASCFFKDYAPFVRNHKYITKLILPSNVIQASLRYVKHRYISDHETFEVIGKDAHLGASWQHRDKPSLLILVVGETARAENFSLDGYSRQTNPLLAKDGVISYSNFHSCGTYTALSVPCMFSVMNRTNYNGDRAHHQSNLMDLLRRAHFNLLWRDNDGGSKGVADRIKYVNVRDFDLAKVCSHGECRDDALLYKLQSYIGKQKGNTVIVLHQMGSHGPTYYQRYSKPYAKFEPTCNTNQIQGCSHQKLVNTYDNTLLYTDQFLNRVIQTLKHNDSRFNTAMLYLSDHGESLGEHGMYLHGAPYMIAPSQQTHIPYIMWFSPGFVHSFDLNTRCLREQRAKHFSQDNLFHSVLGLLDVKTKLYNPKLDLFASCHT